MLTWCASAASWLSTSMARAPCSITTSERVNTEAGLSPVAANTRWIGRSTVAPLATWMTRAVAHQRGVERDHALAVGRHDLAEMRRRPADRPPPAPAPSSGWSGRATDRRGRTVPARRCRRRRRCGARRCRRRAGRRPWRAPWPRHRAAPASGLASRISARRSVYFHSSTRRCGRPSASKRPNAASRSATTLPSPGSFGLRGRKGLGQRLLGGGLHAADFGVHDASAASSWYCA